MLPSAAKAGPPEPPAGLLAATRAAWAGFWASPLAALVIEADHPALERLFELYDERARAWREYREHRVVEGSQGQPVANPLFRVAMALDVEVRALEDRYGLTPAARLKLGIRLGEAARSLEDLARDLDDDASWDEDDTRRILGLAPESDPRLAH